ncbi:MAG: tetratricopeptide repeat protein [Pirellulales bacterium]|nr:tetratricopeptide repeat protein [Pirellulales bacterium]
MTAFPQHRATFSGKSPIGSPAKVMLAVVLVVVFFDSFSFAEKTTEKTEAKAVTAEAKRSPQLQPTEVYKRMLKSTAWLRYLVKGEGYYEGTGWVVDAEKGLLVTNKHVVGDAKEIEVYFPIEKDGRIVLQQDYYLEEVEPLVGEVIDRDTKLDLALVKVDALPKGIIALPLATESPEPGQKVFALGSQPVGSTGMWIFTTGEVRQVYRRRHALGHVARIVETQLPTNCGNSGGAVVNDRAEVVAVVEGHSTVARLVSLFVDISELRDYLDITVRLANPKTAEDYSTRATRRYDEGLYDQAVTDYTESLRLDPDQIDTLINRGWAFYQTDDNDAAIADYNEVLEKDKKCGAAYEARGVVYRYLGDQEKAIEDFTRAIRLDPNNAGLYQRRGTSYEKDGQLEKALADRNRALDRDPDNYDYVYQRGQTLRRLKRYSEALEVFKKAASLNPGSAAVCYEMGYVYMDQKKWEQAEFFFDLAIQRDDTVASFYNNRGLCRLEMKEFQEAGADFIKAIELKPKHAPYHRRLGIVFYEAGQHKIAMKYFNKAVELDPDDADNYDWRADCHEKLGDDEAAAKDRKKMRKLREE